MPSVLWIGISLANHQSPNARLDDGAGTRPGSPTGRTRFERYVQDCAFRDRLFETTKAFDFRMRRARAFVMALCDNLSVDHQDRPYRRIGLVRPRPRRASSRAARMKISSLGALATGRDIS